MKIAVKRNNVVLTLTPTDMSALSELLHIVKVEHERHPVSWLTRSKVTRKIYQELHGAAAGSTGRDPFWNEETSTSEPFKRAFEIVKAGDPRKVFVPSCSKAPAPGRRR